MTAPERLWTEEERSQIGYAVDCAVDGGTAHIENLLDAERRERIELAWGLWQFTYRASYMENDAGVGLEWRGFSGPEIRDALAFLHSLGLLERHPERAWYRLAEKKQ